MDETIFKSGEVCAKRWRVSSRTVRQWAAENLIKSNGDGYDIISGDEHQFLRLEKEISKLSSSGDSTPNNPQSRLTLAQCRKTEAEAGLKELELEERKGLLIPVQEAIDEVKGAFLKVRGKLLSIPSRMALELANVDDPLVIQRLLQDCVDESLENLTVEIIEVSDECNE